MELAEHFSFTCSDPSLPVDADNLCVRAIRRLEERCNIDANVAVHLEKVIPYGAGLGGGSSDAAITLQLVTELLELEVSNTVLHEIAASLGSDIPFFLGASAALGTGRGDMLTQLMNKQDNDRVYSLPYSLLLIVPSIHVSTKEAYQFVNPYERNRPDLAALVQSNDLSRWRAELVNDFEHSVFAVHPGVKKIKQTLYKSGAAYAAMSGSGSSVFGLFEDKNQAIDVGEAFREKEMRVWVE